MSTTIAESISIPVETEPTAQIEDDHAPDVVPAKVLEGDDVAWRSFVARYDGDLRAIVRQATDELRSLTADQTDDVMGDFWLAAVANDMRLLRAFTPSRGSSLLTWLTFHVANIANAYVARVRAEPVMVSLDEALHVAAPWPRPALRVPKRRAAPRPKLPSGREYSEAEFALVADFADFLVKLGKEGKLDEEAATATDGEGKDFDHS